MKKRYILVMVSIILVIAYLDVVNSCARIDCIISDMIKLDSQIKTEIDTTSKAVIKLVKD